MDSEVSVKCATLRNDITECLQTVNHDWLFNRLYSSGVIEQTDIDKQDLTPLCDAIEKDHSGRNLSQLIEILKTESAYNFKAEKLQAKYSKWSNCRVNSNSVCLCIINLFFIL